MGMREILNNKQSVSWPRHSNTNYTAISHHYAEMEYCPLEEYV